MKTVIWSKENCAYCDQAKELLRMHDVPFVENKIGEGYTREDLLEAVPNARSVPQIFMYGRYVGGYTDLEKYFEENISGSTEGKL